MHTIYIYNYIFIINIYSEEQGIYARAVDKAN